MTSRKGMVSAVPENLLKYAQVCTQGAEQLQSWVRTVLTPAINAYEASGHKCYILDGNVAQQVASVYYTDRDVRTVGLAFQKTQEGKVTVRAQGAPVWAKDTDVTAIARQLQLQWANQASWNAGAALAARYLKDHPTLLKDKKAFVDELNRHVNDPYFCASFFSKLDSDQVETMVALGGTQALVKAYESGALGNPGAKAVGDMLAGPIRQPTLPPVNLDTNYITQEQKNALLRTLAQNPVAAGHFAQSLSPEQLSRIFHLEGAQHPELRPLLLSTLTVAVQQVPEGQVRPLMNKVTQGLFAGDEKLSRSEWQSLSKAFKQFYATALPRTIGSMGSPGETPNQLGGRMDQVGKQVGADLMPFIRAAYDADPDHKVLRDMLAGALGNVEGGLVPGGPLPKIAADAAIGAAQAYLQGAGLDPAKGLIGLIPIPEGTPVAARNLNDQVALSAYSMTLSRLLESHNIYPAGAKQGEEQPITVGNDPAAKQSRILDMLRHPEKYQVGKDVPEGEGRNGESAPDLRSFGARFWNQERTSVEEFLNQEKSDG
ncbi:MULTISPECIES: hypothetical protein [unclassified Streptomyces]|uniref:hypothetical protein n=1 Tax=unclassified Streptomyces TaxID=2593676 RepID=UPI00278C61C2|nr:MULTISPECIES: hypothetical protein [unclassified Streptomyces]